MDPNDNLARMLKLASEILVELDLALACDFDLSPVESNAMELSELVLAMDGWLKSGGFPPHLWTGEE